MEVRFANHFCSLSFISFKLLTMMNALFSLVVLVVVIFACHGCLEDEERSLLLFRKMLKSNYFFTTRKEGSDCCNNWEGVVCNPLTHHVQSLDFSSDDDEEAVAIQYCETLLPLSNLQGLTSLDILVKSLNVSLVLAYLGRFPSLSVISLGYSSQKQGSSISSAFQEWPSEVLQRLTSLDLSDNSLYGSLPSQLQNMTRLAYLDLSLNNFNSDFHELRGLSNLRHLLLDGLNPDKVLWSAWNFSRLVELSLEDFSLEQHPIEQMKWLQLNKGMESLFLEANMLTDISFIGHFPHLRELDASGNSIKGRIPMSIGNLSSLEWLDLSYSSLRESIPCSLTNLSRLAYLDVSYNQLNGSISCLALSSSLTHVDFGENQMEGTISEAFLSNLVNLDYLGMTRSGLSMNVSNTWIPGFSCRKIRLGSCKINSSFLGWISTQPDLAYLDLSDNRLYGEIPSWLWELPPQGFLAVLNLSHNELEGHVNDLGHFSTVDLSFNNFKGSMPALFTLSKSSFYSSHGYLYLNLRNNGFEGPLTSDVAVMYLHFLDASNNKLTGPIPSVYNNCSKMEFLNLANNNLNGSLPIGFGGNFQYLKYLSLFNNKLEGTLPESLSASNALQVLNVGNNVFGGQFSKWITQLKELRILEMRSNRLEGNIPEELGTMPYLHIIDISSNSISGQIPKSISALPTLLKQVQDSSSENNSVFISMYSEGRSYHGFTITTFEEIEFIVKGLLLPYRHIPMELTCIDLSNNLLTGEIPTDLGNLKGLMFLNLSRNHLTGYIPASIGEMSGLEELDLSANQLSGGIPNEFVRLYSMGFLNLSYNNLSGRIPREGQMLTFDEKIFQGNPNLNDSLLPTNRKRPTQTQTGAASEDESGEHDQAFWWAIAVGVSYGIGFGSFVSAWILIGRFRKYVNSSMDAIILWLFRYRY